MNRGYFVIAANSEECNYVRLAYGLAMSIKATQSKYTNLSIAVNSLTDVPDDYKWAFDKIIEIPVSKLSKLENYNFRHEAMSYDLSPYDETIKLEADMLLFSDISHWWNNLSKHNVQIPNTVVDYKDCILNTQYYRQCFIQNDLYSAHSCFMFFNKSKEAKRFFETVTEIFLEWESYSWYMIHSVHQTEPTTDIVFGMAVVMLEKNHEYQPFLKKQTFAHMRSFAFDLKRGSTIDDWTIVLGYRFTPELELFVNNFKQTKPFHYQIKTFLTDEMLSYYEAKLNG